MIATSDAHATAARIKELGTATIALADALARASDVQWLKPAAPSVRENDASRRTSRAVADPTSELVADPRHLRVRAAVISGELAASELAAKASTVTADLRAAVSDWAGVRA